MSDDNNLTVSLGGKEQPLGGKTAPYNPYQVFPRINGTNGTIGVFQFATGNQESIGEDGANINTVCYHTKVYSIDKPINLNLGAGVQDGQLKRITMVHKGTEGADVTVTCPTLFGNTTKVLFSNVGDQLELVWSGYSWSVLSTMNFMDPSSQTPWVS